MQHSVASGKSVSESSNPASKMAQDEIDITNSSFFRYDEEKKVLVCKYFNVPRPGLILALITTVSFSVCGAIAKSVTSKVGPGEVVAVRYLISAFFMLWPVVFDIGCLNMSFGKVLRLCIGGLLGGATTYIAYTAYLYLPLMDAQTLFNVQGVFVAVLACVFLKEPIGFIELTSLTIVMGGVVLVCQPSFIFDTISNSEKRTFGVGLALLCALCQGLTGIFCRSLKELKFYVFTFALSCGGVLVSLATIPLVQGMPVPNDWRQVGMMTAIGVLAVISKASLTAAFRYEEATPVTLIQSLEIVGAFLFQWLFFAELPNYLEIIGALFILLGITLLTAKKYFKKKINQFISSCRSPEKVSERQPIIQNV